MKLWYGYGAEHSMNLVMIGRFRDAAEAAKANEVIERLIQRVSAEVQDGTIQPGEHTDRFSDPLRALISELDLYTIGPAELEQFAYDVTVRLERERVVIKSDEADLSAFLKVLIDQGARVEVYSAHRHADADPDVASDSRESA